MPRKVSIDGETYIEEEKQCPRCGSPMKLKKGRFGIFYGCVAWAETKCGRSIKYLEEEEVEPERTAPLPPSDKPPALPAPPVPQVRQPDEKECGRNELLDVGDQIGVAVFYPKVTGFSQRAIVIPGQNTREFDVVLWPEAEGAPPQILHHSDARDFLKFGAKIQTLRRSSWWA